MLWPSQSPDLNPISTKVRVVGVYLQLSGVAQLCAVISWFVSTICRLVRDGADLPPARARKAAL